ncbi:SGNH/GDSL hydrolase family protein [Tautonia plasticadhaerens]|uniref:Phosphatidylcholine-sterol acyltransferase n=1 Tax=Tautonia plasticadhaerens TaxID=2527974 RepID=A0A518GWS9_9BACT|nr:SGNH/GDSL hydrolase family protein [Tautonia plasticadhaerens]QDV33012.1 Phosphatidylcholine-sterol acyltransferase precursor [Tautonia plasticadhaerens]
MSLNRIWGAVRPVATAMIALGLVAAEAGAGTTIYAFGDSLMDTGNVLERSGGTVPTPPYAGGRFTNGPVFVEVLADQLGLARPTPSLLGGTNYAYGGARTGDGAGPVFFRGELVPVLADNVGMQVDTFILGGGSLDADDLVVINGGGNDILSVLLGVTPDPVGWAGELVSSIAELAGVGGSRFVVANLPPLGLTPLLRSLGGDLPGTFNLLSSVFNQALDAGLDALEASLGLEIFRLDVEGITAASVADPGRFGLSNATDAAFPIGGDVVANPDEYLFWDDVHPTAAGHRLVGVAAAQLVIPEPSSLALSALGAASGLLAVAARRRRAA